MIPMFLCLVSPASDAPETNKGCRANEATYIFASLGTAEKKRFLLNEVSISDYILRKRLTDVQRFHSKYPFNGAGVVLSWDRHHETDEGQVWSIRVAAVWKGSPADQSDIRPGDWLLKVDGNRVSGVLFQPTDSQNQERNKRNRLQASMRMATEKLGDRSDKVKVSIERSGRRINFDLQNAMIGNNVLTFVVQHSQEWENQLDGMKRKLLGIEEQIRKSNDSANLVACMCELLMFSSSPLSDPQDEVIRFIKKTQLYLLSDY